MLLPAVKMRFGQNGGQTNNSHKGQKSGQTNNSPAYLLYISLFRHCLSDLCFWMFVCARHVHVHVSDVMINVLFPRVSVRVTKCESGSHMFSLCFSLSPSLSLYVRVCVCMSVSLSLSLSFSLYFSFSFHGAMRALMLIRLAWMLMPHNHCGKGHRQSTGRLMRRAQYMERADYLHGDLLLLLFLEPENQWCDKSPEAQISRDTTWQQELLKQTYVQGCSPETVMKVHRIEWTQPVSRMRLGDWRLSLPQNALCNNALQCVRLYENRIHAVAKLPSKPLSMPSDQAEIKATTTAEWFNNGTIEKWCSCIIWWFELQI